MFDLVLRALDVRVRASRDQFHVEGSLPGIDAMRLDGVTASSMWAVRQPGKTIAY